MFRSQELLEYYNTLINGDDKFVPDSDIGKTFSVEPVIAFRKVKSLKQLIGVNNIQNDKNVKTSSIK